MASMCFQCPYYRESIDFDDGIGVTKRKCLIGLQPIRKDGCKEAIKAILGYYKDEYRRNRGRRKTK